MEGIMLGILNKEAKKGGGSVIVRDQMYRVLDENGIEVFASSQAIDVGSWLQVRNKLGIPFSLQRGKNRKR